MQLALANLGLAGVYFLEPMPFGALDDATEARIPRALPMLAKAARRS